MSPTATRRPARCWGDHYRGLGRCHCGQPRSRSPPPGPRLAPKNVLTWVGLHVFAFFPIFSPRHVPTQQDAERPPSQRSRDWVDVAAPPDSRGGHRSPVPERLLSAPRFHSDARCVCGLPTSDSLEHTRADSLGAGSREADGPPRPPGTHASHPVSLPLSSSSPFLERAGWIRRLECVSILHVSLTATGLVRLGGRHGRRELRSGHPLVHHAGFL